MYDIKELLLKYTKNRKLIIILLMLILGIILIFIPSEKHEAKISDSSFDIIRDGEEKRLVGLLREIDGIKNAKVMISYSDNGSKEYYYDENEENEEVRMKKSSKLVALRGNEGENPVLIREKAPEINGASIVITCEPGLSEEVVYKTVSRALGIEVHKIQIVLNDGR
ncbi:MAG: hypothetical protein E7411_06205 [Ruminococcaceae bacterium]|nr:hypothetical protein [Oscillospiraceae bacterium]